MYGEMHTVYWQCTGTQCHDGVKAIEGICQTPTVKGARRYQAAIKEAKRVKRDPNWYLERNQTTLSERDQSEIPLTG